MSKHYYRVYIESELPLDDLIDEWDVNDVVTDAVVRNSTHSVDEVTVSVERMRIEKDGTPSTLVEGVA